MKGSLELPPPLEGEGEGINPLTKEIVGIAGRTAPAAGRLWIVLHELAYPLVEAFSVYYSGVVLIEVKQFHLAWWWKKKSLIIAGECMIVFYKWWKLATGLAHAYHSPCCTMHKQLPVPNDKCPIEVVILDSNAPKV